MSLTKTDLKQIKSAVADVTDPHFSAIQKDFVQVNERLERIEKFLLEDHRRRIERLETRMQRLEGLFVIK